MDAEFITPQLEQPHEQPESEERPREDPPTPDDEEGACDPLDLRPRARDLLKQHKRCNSGNPPQVHYACNKQQTHQQPAAPDAIETMTQPHLQRPPGSVPPLGQDEAQRRPAVPEAGLLKRWKLENTRAGQKD